MQGCIDNLTTLVSSTDDLEIANCMGNEMAQLDYVKMK
jgi:hypothetical protein